MNQKSFLSTFEPNEPKKNKRQTLGLKGRAREGSYGQFYFSGDFRPRGVCRAPSLACLTLHFFLLGLTRKYVPIPFGSSCGGCGGGTRTMSVEVS